MVKMNTFKTVAFIIYLILSTEVSSEPQCSPFHYQEQMLEKMIKLELLVQKMKEDMDVTHQQVRDSTETINNDMQAMKLEWKDESAKFNKEFSEIKTKAASDAKKYAEYVENIKGAAETPSIVFLAKTLKNLSPSNGDTLIFQNTEFNDGQGYDTNTGEFTAPVNGTYLFTMQLCVPGGVGRYSYYDFRNDDKVIKAGLFQPGDRSDCYNSDAVTSLRKGMKVWVTCRTITTSFIEGSQYWNSFSGVLLHQ